MGLDEAAMGLRVEVGEDIASGPIDVVEPGRVHGKGSVEHGSWKMIARGSSASRSCRTSAGC